MNFDVTNIQAKRAKAAKRKTTNHKAHTEAMEHGQK